MTSIFLNYFDDLLATPEDVEQLNRAILHLAIQGKLLTQDNTDEPASEILKRIIAAKSELNIKELFSPIGDDEKPFELPKAWEWTRLNDICSQITDGTHYTPKYLYDGVPFLSVKDVSKGFLDFSNTRFISQEEHDLFATRCKPELGDVILTKVGTTGIAVVVDTEKEFSIFVSLALLKFFQNEIAPEFLALVINSPFMKGLSEKYTMGVGNKNLVLKHIKSFPIPLPPFTEQQRIVARVEELFVQTRALAKELAHSQIELDGLSKSALSHLLASETTEEFNQHWSFIAEDFDLLFQAPEHIAPLRQSILELAVRGKLTQDTHDWKIESLEDISSDADYGTSQKCDYGASDTPVLRIPNVAGGKINLDNLKHATKPEELGKENSLLPNDFLIVRTNGSKDLVGKGSVVMQEFDNTTYFASYLIRYRLIHYGVWINTIWNSRLIREQVEKIAVTSAGQYNVNIKNLNGIQIPIPPLAEQERIAKRVEQLLSLCDALEARLQSAEEERGRLVRAVMSTVGG
jgi:type I restriction enzyme, S subunit